MTAQPEQPTPRRRQVLYLAAVVAAVGVAWGVHRQWVSPTGSAGSERRVLAAMATADRLSPPPATSPDSPLPDPWSLTGLVPFDRDPANVPPPAGATFVAGFRRRSGPWLEQRAKYEYAGGPPDALAHYQQRLGELGFKRFASRRLADGGAVDIYVTGAAKAEVALRKPPPGSTISSISLRIIAPANSDE